MKSPVRIFRNSRRNWLKQTGALASAAATPLWVREASAQSTALNALPRIALIIGNTKYADAPLKNPANDARALAGELQKTGFSVKLLVDAGRAQMAGAIQTFGEDLAKSRGVGLFYYAGHGAQLAWRNYLIPVDAVIEKLGDLRDKTVDLGALLQGLLKASNPMNVIILDACRDNPFGTRVPTEAKGLSQFDVPPGSLLAYATAPGHTAGDGEGVNGLYTENLLREIRVPDAKIEDVFKRVRLSVRRRSEGQQIPWESTSLEDDFYFLPPKQKKALSEEELEKQFEDELTIWENIKASKDPAPLEDYIRRFPGGKFSELAQFRLDRLLTEREKNLPNAGRHGTAAPALQAAANPFSKGTAKVDFSYRIGDRFLFRDIDLQTKLETGRRRWTVTAITDDEVTFNGGKVTTDLLGNLRMNSRGLSFIDRQIFVAEYSLGRKWTTVYEGIGRTGKPNEWAISLKVVNRETLTVPAGTFNAFRIEGNGSSRSGSSFQITYWVAPDKVPSYLVYEQVQTTQQGRIIVANRAELAEYRQSAGARS